MSQHEDTPNAQEKTLLPISPLVTVLSLLPVLVLDAAFYVWISFFKSEKPT